MNLTLKHHLKLTKSDRKQHGDLFTTEQEKAARQYTACFPRVARLNQKGTPGSGGVLAGGGTRVSNDSEGRGRFVSCGATAAIKRCEAYSENVSYDQ